MKPNKNIKKIFRFIIYFAYGFVIGFGLSNIIRFCIVKSQERDKQEIKSSIVCIPEIDETKTVQAKEPEDSNSGVSEAYPNGEASFYNRSICELHGKTYQADCFTANGNLFDDTADTAACLDRFLNRIVRVCYGGNCIKVLCNDTGSFEKKYSRVIDLSEAAFAKLAPLSSGVIPVEIEVIN